MADNNYDIFISYRRDGGADFARHMQLKLQNYNYKVFLDYDELKDGKFDERIMRAIESAPVFMIILSEHSLDKCCNDGDWVRREIEYAIKCNKHIIPINPDRQFSAFPDDCPEIVRSGVGQHQFTEIFTGQQFNTTVDNMIQIRIEPIVTPGKTMNAVGAEIHLEVDLDCQVFDFSKMICTARAGKDNEVRLRKGKHKLNFVSIENEEDQYSTLFEVEDNDIVDILTVELQPARKKRLEEEERKRAEEQRQKEEERNRKLNIPDNDIEPFEYEGKYGFKVKFTNEILVQPTYDFATFFIECLATVALNGEYGYIDKTGKVVIPLKYDDAGYFSEGLADVVLNGKYGYIDKTGKVVIPLRYDEADPFSEDLAAVALNGKLSYIDKTGKVVISLNYHYAGYFSEGLAAVELNDKYGYIDKTSKEVIPLKYDDAGDFSEGLACVKLNKKWGYINKTGKEVIPLKYDEAWDFSDGLAKVKLNGKEFYIDKNGNRVD